MNSTMYAFESTTPAGLNVFYADACFIFKSSGPGTLTERTCTTFYEKIYLLKRARTAAWCVLPIGSSWLFISSDDAFISFTKLKFTMYDL